MIGNQKSVDRSCIIQEHDIQKWTTRNAGDQNEALSINDLTPNYFLVELLTNIKLQGYRFIAVSPSTHERFLSKTKSQGKNLRDIFGWSMTFSKDALCPMIEKIMNEGNFIVECGDSFHSLLRIATLGSDLFLHSSFPTTEHEAVFFGPDTYRFARFIRQSLEKYQYTWRNDVTLGGLPLRILDIGCGTGAGGIAAVRALPHGTLFELTMNDINSYALEFACANAFVAEVPIKVIAGDIFKNIHGEFDLIISNPPYMQDDSDRAYRNGGAQLGLDLSIRIFKTAYEHLAPGGKLILYTGVAMTTPLDPFLNQVTPLLANADCSWSYEEIDPDIFGEELERPAYFNVHRIAAIGLVVTRH
ncbi:MAG: methyltransferase domain-containing protein [Gammaproteobacteria bacterium]|nr:MAG: methyltransferase domain-containing protein [Gammaproteobacteria bacterium]